MLNLGKARQHGVAHFLRWTVWQNNSRLGFKGNKAVVEFVILLVADCWVVKRVIIVVGGFDFLDEKFHFLYEIHNSP